MDSTVVDRAFAQDVSEGLSAEPKRLSSRYFYDARGDHLFQEIMASLEYYLTDCELEILREQSDALAGELAEGGPFELVELGSGDGSKVGFLLDALHRTGVNFRYRPVDISDNSLELLTSVLRPGRKWLDMQPLHADYMAWLAEINPGSVRRVFAYLGSNLGNFRFENAVSFLSRVRAAMGPSDALLIGLDLKKAPEIVKAAYNDAAGHTREFNLNLLQRINRELGADFRLDRFSHQPEYDPESGAAFSFLRSEVEQQVHVGALQTVFHFKQGERIFMEVSQKYDQAMIESLASAAGLYVAADFRDRRGWFTDQVWRPVQGT